MSTDGIDRTARFLHPGGDNCGIEGFLHLMATDGFVRKLRVLTRSLITAATWPLTHLITIDDNVNPTLTAPASLTAVCDISEQPAYTALC